MARSSALLWFASLAARLGGVASIRAPLPEDARCPALAECPQLPVAVCGDRCACPACPILNEPQGPGCGMHGCVYYVEEFAVIANNSVYRMSDLVHHSGTRWRVDSTSILCMPRFRGTLMRDLLTKTSTYDGKRLADLKTTVMEERVMGINEGRQGYACTTGESGAATGRGLMLATSEQQLEGLAYLVAERAESGRCGGARSTDLVVSLRMGDVRPNVTAVQLAVEQALEQASSVVTIARSQKPHTTPPEAQIGRVLFNGILHYGGYSHVPKASRQSVETNIAVVRQLEAWVRSKGLLSAVRSVPDADDDLCFLALSRNVVGGFRGYARLVAQVRRLLPTKLSAGLVSIYGDDIESRLF